MWASNLVWNINQTDYYSFQYWFFWVFWFNSIPIKRFSLSFIIFFFYWRSVTLVRIFFSWKSSLSLSLSLWLAVIHFQYNYQVSFFFKPGYWVCSKFQLWNENAILVCYLIVLFGVFFFFMRLVLNIVWKRNSLRRVTWKWKWIV